MKSLRQLSSVVLPVPVPPEMRMFRRPSTAARRNSAAVRVIAPLAIRSSTSSLRSGNLRIVSVGPLTASGAITALTRLPSESRASTSGCERSMRRPTLATIRWMIDSMTASEMNRRPEFCRLPLRSM